MESDFIIFIRMVFTALFVLTLLAGVYLVRNREKLFGVHPDIPSASRGARDYNQFQIFVIWAHAVVLTGAFALLLH